MRIAFLLMEISLPKPLSRLYLSPTLTFMNTRAIAPFATAGILACLASTTTQAADSGSGPYTILNPVPADQMRPMVSDQAMFTLTPFTVDAGHFQLETDLFDYFHDRERGGGVDQRFTGWSVGRMTLKAGLCNRVDLGVSFTAYSRLTTEDIVAGTKTVQDGINNITPSLKINLWGNDSGTTALALVPYVSIPTTQLTPGYEDYSGGLQVAFSWRLPYEFKLGLLTGFDVYENGVGDWHPQFINGISLRRTVYGNLNAYGEFFTVMDEETDDWSSLVNAGLAYQITKDVEVNVGVTAGTRNDIDWNPYIGLSWRF
jgi:hypothetical protein